MHHPGREEGRAEGAERRHEQSEQEKEGAREAGPTPRLNVSEAKPVQQGQGSERKKEDWVDVPPSQ